ncbi:MAG: segregation/condensation protein A [Patescibacteria group bacterium]|nr:segregation/condensation protein A [Patescibacteria group bacterium]
MYKIRTESFEGPLHLLLQLIEQEKLDINEVSLAQVADQYLAYIKQIEEKNPEEMADFLIIATKLILIKSKSLLPNLDLGLEEDEALLEEQLKMYREFVLASENIQNIIEQKNFTFSRNKYIVNDAVFSPPVRLTKERLSEIFYEIISSVKPILKLPEKAIKRAISIKEKIDFIQKLIKRRSVLIFNKVINDTKNKTEKVVSFLALLELMKNRLVSASQNKIFDNITLKKL